MANYAEGKRRDIQLNRQTYEQNCKKTDTENTDQL